jgi:hypothetical protein
VMLGVPEASQATTRAGPIRSEMALLASRPAQGRVLSDTEEARHGTRGVPRRRRSWWGAVRPRARGDGCVGAEGLAAHTCPSTTSKPGSYGPPIACWWGRSRGAGHGQARGALDRQRPQGSDLWVSAEPVPRAVGGRGRSGRRFPRARSGGLAPGTDPAEGRQSPRRERTRLPRQGTGRWGRRADQCPRAGLRRRMPTEQPALPTRATNETPSAPPNCPSAHLVEQSGPWLGDICS